MTKRPKAPAAPPPRPEPLVPDNEIVDDPDGGHLVASERWCNDEFINQLVWEADRDNDRKERVTKCELFVYLNHANRLRLANEHGYEGKRLAAFGKRILGFGASKLKDIRKIGDPEIAAEILRHCEVDRARAIAKGVPWAYPSWRSAFFWIFPKKVAAPPDDDEDDDDAEDDENHGGEGTLVAEDPAPSAGEDLTLGIAHDLLAEKLAAAQLKIRDLENRLKEVAEPQAEPIIEPIAEPVAERVPNAAAEPIAEPVVAEPAIEPVADATGSRP